MGGYTLAFRARDDVQQTVGGANQELAFIRISRTECKTCIFDLVLLVHLPTALLWLHSRNAPHLPRFAWSRSLRLVHASKLAGIVHEQLVRATLYKGHKAGILRKVCLLLPLDLHLKMVCLYFLF